MKPLFKSLPLLLVSFALYGAATATLQAQIPIPTAVPSAYEGHFISWPAEAHLNPDPADHGDFQFLRMIRAWRGPEISSNYSENRGWDNLDGWFTMESHSLAYITAFLTDESGELVLQENGQPIPIKTDVYHWSKSTYLNGRVSWLASYTEVDWQTVTGKGFAWGYAEENIFSPINGAAEFSTTGIGDAWILDSVGWKTTEPIAEPIVNEK